MQGDDEIFTVETFTTERYSEMAHLRAVARAPSKARHPDPLRRFVRAPGEPKIERLHPTKDSERAVTARH